METAETITGTESMTDQNQYGVVRSLEKVMKYSEKTSRFRLPCCSTLNNGLASPCLEEKFWNRLAFITKNDVRMAIQSNKIHAVNVGESRHPKKYTRRGRQCMAL